RRGPPGPEARGRRGCGRRSGGRGRTRSSPTGGGASLPAGRARWSRPCAGPAPAPRVGPPPGLSSAYPNPIAGACPPPPSPPEEGGDGLLSGEVLEGVGGAAGEEVLHRERAGGHADRFGPDGAGGGHVPRGIPDHHHPAFRERHVQMGGTALGPDPDELGPVLVVAAEAAEAKGSEKAHALELEARAFPHVARAQADRVSLSLRGLPDGTLHAGVNPACGGALEFFLQVPEVDGEEVVDLGLGRLDPDPGERGADDGPVGHPVEGEGEGVAATVSVGKGPLDGPPGRTSGGDQRAVDVEEEDGRSQLSSRPKSAVTYSRGSNGRRSARDSPTPTRRTGI